MTEYGVAELDLGLTKSLAHVLAEIDPAALPDPVVHETRRALLDWAGCAIAGSTHPAIAKLMTVLAAANPEPAASAFCQGRKIGVLAAPLANGQMGHVLDYDDTHMGGVVLHTSSPIYAAMLALAEREGIGGADLVAGCVAGFEAGVRAGQAAPRHHDGGWHLTGTLGSIAAAAACARLLRLDGQQMTHAIAIGATQAGGMQQNRGTMCKSLHSGKAAANGVLAALLAREGFDSSEEILEGKRGFCRIFSTETDESKLTDGLGERWEIVRNGYKPYACGIVLHPAIDTAIALGRDGGIPADAVAKITVRVNPKAVRITGVADPKTGLKSKFSISHATAVGFIDGTAGTAQFADGRATAPDVVALRERVEVITDEGYRADQASGVVEATDGKRFETTVDHATGTVDNPMSDDFMAEKFMANAAPITGEDRAAEIRDLIWQLDSLETVDGLMAACRG